ESESYVVNGLNQYTSVGGSPQLYDLNGNLSSDGATSFGYDAENRLVAASGAQTAALAYDPLGRLFEISGPADSTQFLYDGDRLVAEYDGSGNLERRYVCVFRPSGPPVPAEAGHRFRTMPGRCDAVVGLSEMTTLSST
ncbi:MAG: hypothetical protein ACREQ1_16590, partial [Woeseiaceae bacterium]